MQDWRDSPRVALAATALLLAIQIGVPVIRFGPADIPQRWAWQMFSKSPQSVHFSVETALGVEAVDIGEYTARTRGDIDLTKTLPAHLCAVHPAALRVTWDDESLECSSG